MNSETRIGGGRKVALGLWVGRIQYFFFLSTNLNYIPSSSQVDILMNF